jgi:cell division inhibitor SulA
MALTLRDLRRLATGPLPDTPQDWEQRMYARFALLPDQAQPLQRSWLTAAFSAGTKIIQLRHLCPRFGLNRDLGVALEAVARGNCAEVTAKLAEIDAALTSRPGEVELRARGLILAISEALTQHAAYFGAGAPA